MNDEAPDREDVPVHHEHVPVLIAGGGPVGLTLAALLGRYGVRCLVIEADDSYCTGSRAICVSRRSQEIFGWVGGDRALVEKGLPWTGGRSYFRGAEVLHFRMPSEPGERFAPMLNIQQFHVEEIAHLAAIDSSTPAEVRWSSKVTSLRQHEHFVDADIVDASGRRSVVRADWLVACDGGRSTVREQSGLTLEGTQYEGRYVIVDIEQATDRAVERLAWFDPPSNPGSTILMHRQPGNIWRIDYQIADDEDPVEAVKPENVLPRVQSHLQMIGENAPWKPLWISIYNAKCLTLNDYRKSRVLFAGDAAHLVPIFGVRGLNSGLDDAGNLAWKLALVLQGKAAASLLDTYSTERVHAARRNIEFGAKSTEFMAPPHFGFRLMREAALRLATESTDESETVRGLINPRQSTPIRYESSESNAPGDASQSSPRGGDTAPEARMSDRHLTELFGSGFVVLLFSDDDGAEKRAREFVASIEMRAGPASLAIWRIAHRPVGRSKFALFDDTGEAWRRYAAAEGTVVLVRPDGYILSRWPEFDEAVLCDALSPFRRDTAETRIECSEAAST